MALILLDFFNGLIFAILGAVMVSIFYYIFVISSEKWEKEEKEAISKFFKALDKKFDLDLIMDRSDVEILYSAIEREFDLDYHLIHLLEDYLVNLGEHEDQDSKLSKKYKTIKEFIELEKADKPFADVPEEERRLLIGMRDAIQNKDEESALQILSEVSSVISTRNNDYEKAMSASKWARPLAIIGLVASILLGTLALLK